MVSRWMSREQDPVPPRHNKGIWRFFIYRTMHSCGFLISRLWCRSYVPQEPKPTVYTRNVSLLRFTHVPRKKQKPGRVVWTGAFEAPGEVDRDPAALFRKASRSVRLPCLRGRGRVRDSNSRLPSVRPATGENR